MEEHLRNAVAELHKAQMLVETDAGLYGKLDDLMDSVGVILEELEAKGA